MKKSLLLLSSLFVFASQPVVHASDVESIIESREELYKDSETTELFSGEWIVGQDIKPGRYKITTLDGQSGNFFIYENETEEYPFVNFILENNGFGLGVEEANFDIQDGQVIELSGMDNVIFEPVESEIKTELTTGMWVVGVDVEAGTYVATTAEDTSGNLFVYENGDYPDGYPTTNAVLGKGENNIGSERIQLKLKDGQVIVISGISTLFLD